MTEKEHNGFFPKLKVWSEEVRAPFLTASLVPIVLGAVIAWARHDEFSFFYFLLTLLGGFLLHAGTNVANDYFDHKSRDDDINTEFVRPFSGGSRLIQKGILSPREVIFGSLILFGAGSLIGFYIAYARGLPILYLGVLGVFSGFFYTAPPFRLAHRGIGEIFIGTNFGVLMTLGSYFVQAQRFSFEPFFASLPVSFLIAAVVYINEFPDYTADRAVGKHHLVVRLGKERAVYGYVLLMIATYGFILLGVAARMLSPFCLLGLLTLPQTLKAVRTLKMNYDDSRALAPANASTIMVHLFTGLLMSAGYILDKFLL